MQYCKSKVTKISENSIHNTTHDSSNTCNNAIQKLQKLAKKHAMSQLMTHKRLAILQDKLLNFTKIHSMSQLMCQLTPIVF